MGVVDKGIDGGEWILSQIQLVAEAVILKTSYDQLGVYVFCLSEQSFIGLHLNCNKVIVTYS